MKHGTGAVYSCSDKNIKREVEKRQIRQIALYEKKN